MSRTFGDPRGKLASMVSVPYSGRDPACGHRRVAAREGPGFDALFVYQPVQHLRRTIGGIRRQKECSSLVCLSFAEMFT